MRQDILLVCNTPFHIVLAQALLRDLDLRADLVQTVSPVQTLAYLDADRWRDVVYVESLSPRDTREPRGSSRGLACYRLAVLCRSVFGYRLKRQGYDAVYIFNDADVTNQLFLSRLHIGSVVLLDDGLTWATRQHLPQAVIAGGLKRRLKRVLGLYGEEFRGRVRSGGAYIFGATAPAVDTHSFGAVLERQRAYVQSLASRCDLAGDDSREPDYVVLTQPFTEEGMCRHMEEVDVICRFLRRVPSAARVLVKLHPWERAEKYRPVYEAHANVRILPEIKMPYELLHVRLRPKYLVGFSSAALVMSQYFYRSRVISLLKWFTSDLSVYVELLNDALGPEICYLDESISPVGL